MSHYQNYVIGIFIFKAVIGIAASSQLILNYYLYKYACYIIDIHLWLAKLIKIIVLAKSYYTNLFKIT